MKQTQSTMLHHNMMLLTTLAAILVNLAVVPAQELTPTPSARIEHTTGDQSPIIHTESGDVQLTYGVPPELFAEYVKKLALTEDTVKRFFKVLAQEQIPCEEWDSKLQEIAAQYKELLQRLEFVQSEDPQVKELKTQARQTIEVGKFADAETLLNQAETRDVQAIDQLRKDIIERQAALEKRQISAAETKADNARLQRIQLRYVKAAEYWLQAAELLSEGVQQRADYLNEAGYDFYRVARYTDALPLYEQSLAIQREIGNIAGEGMMLNSLAGIYIARGDYATALTYVEQSLAIRRKIGDTTGKGATLNSLAEIYIARGDYATALTCLKQCLAIFREIGDKAHEGGTLNNLAWIYIERDDYATALTYLEQSLSIMREIGDKAGEGMTLNNLSQIYDAQGDDMTALTYLEQSLAIAQEIGDKAGEGRTLNNLGQIYESRDDDATALQYYEQSLTIQREIGDKAGEGVACWNIGQIYLDQGDLAKAEEYISRTVQIDEEIGHPDLEQDCAVLEKIRTQIQSLDIIRK